MNKHPLWLLILLFNSPRLLAGTGTAFSELPAETQTKIRKMVEPPPPAQRHGCYSIPMYYLMYKGYEYAGNEDKGPKDRCYIQDRAGPDYGSWKLDRNRPDWQEAMLKDCAELGLNNTHLNIYPLNNSLVLPPEYLQAIGDYAKLSEKHGLKVGVRLDGLGGTVGWEINPANPRNQIDGYIKWAKRIAEQLKGKTAYYVLGDELTLHKASGALPDKAWTPENYLSYFKRVSGAIKEVDPSAKVSMFAASSGEWFNVLYLLNLGYAKFGDGVAINHYDYNTVPKFFADAGQLAPGLLFYANGVGYCSNGTVTPRYPEGDPYSKLMTEQAHGDAIAKSMFAWWDLGAATAPYYISLRNWVKDGKTYPRWFGFFGFEDYVIDQDQLTVRHYPGWQAFQTVALTFYNRDEFKPPAFAIDSSTPLQMFRAYEHVTNRGAEIVLMCWNDSPVKTRIRLGSRSYAYPVKVSPLDYRQWSDLPYEINENLTSIELEVGSEPVIVRLVRAE
jgi:hypothetical protein